ncbi:Serine/threonine-protein kinase ppk15 [Tritrichomonas foetus]|uniref:Serine/threonine-protein kinase ppk15 n=1 Tax=Tritrichomonas foetus TaxID=1144522 RepID=A0A1J4JCD9_9EUKA|nr:Serine/threonine-protein kinase ppk15 [Tritrichomonas foetus]|eukprot:OHS94932.1 Serine/threonine-protein kinase ppk15 [Tritrichomonas foetus]
MSLNNPFNSRGWCSYEKEQPVGEPLTTPSEPVGNNDLDNVNGDLIVRKNMIIFDGEGHRFQVKKWLGSGQFGQVYKCVFINPPVDWPNRKLAIKISKSTTDAHNMFQYESQALQYLKKFMPIEDQLLMSTYEFSFIYCNHYCIVIELLGNSLYDELKLNKFKGFSLSYVQAMLRCILPVLSSLSSLGLMHCDVKPENILKSSKINEFKLIDFGSCLFSAGNEITYVQSRFYRAPEVVLGLPYDSKVDIWSLGCVTIEITLGLPLFPAMSERHLISLINDTIAQIPIGLAEQSPKYHLFFDLDGNIKSAQVMCDESGEDFAEKFQPYFVEKRLADIFRSYEPLNEEDIRYREQLLDLLINMLKVDPFERCTAEEAMDHPFMHIRFPS